MRLRFRKMQGLGNDFVVIDAYTQTIALTPAQIKRLTERRWGVGCDQVLLVQPPQDPAADFYYRIFNADGSEAEQCGNGARCFLRFVREQGLTAKTAIQVQTVNGMLSLEQTANGEISVDMGEPQFEPNKIPFASMQRAAYYSLQTGEQNLRIGAVSMGNPHAVLQVENVASAPVAQIGPQLERHPQFPQGVNVGFMQIVDRHHIHLRVYERGAGETLACGSGACAAVAVGRIQGLLAEDVQVRLPGGALMIHWPGEGHSLRMRGPAETVFEGEITL